MHLEQLTSSALIDLNNPSANLATNLRHNLNIRPPPGFAISSPNSFSSRASFNLRGHGHGRGGHGDGIHPVCQLCGRVGHVAIQGNQGNQFQAAAPLSQLHQPNPQNS
ncbi:hypothetical protein TorRG33x02_007460 [Trema orientale]|uniref:Uncharacterized protein n=1 Tax=Trema orientale TaxID=63057 RepID=A0A2P5G0I6_TREOI|nr:hypothetical protein TorRG33x02_007460 [Trema orientale]